MSVAAPVFRRGKVREMYAVGDDRLLMVASDRVSAFDVVMAEPIPGKGAVLTALSKFWFEAGPRLSCPTTLSDDPADLPAGASRNPRKLWRDVAAGAARRAHRLSSASYGATWPARPGPSTAATGTVAGEPLPAGMLEAQQLEQPIFTPAIKSESGHDENISRARMAASWSGRASPPNWSS